MQYYETFRGDEYRGFGPLLLNVQLLRRVDWGILSEESGEMKRDILSPKGHGPRIAAILS